MNKIKIGVIGAGWWATENHIPHLLERSEVELTSVCKLEEDQLKFVKEKFGFKFASTNYKEMLQLSDLDGVIISSPHHAHFENAKAALEKKCHVMIEKPMTTNVKDAEILIELAKKYNKFLNEKDYWNVVQWLFFQMAYVGPMLGQAHQYLFYHPGKSEFAEKKSKDYTRHI